MPDHATLRQRALRRLLIAARIAVVAGLIAVLARLIHPGDLARARALVGRMRWSLALVLLPTLVAMAIDALGWRTILRTLGHRVRWRRMLELRLSVEAIVLAMPGGSVAGEAAKVALLERRAEVPLAVGAASLALTKLQLIASDAIYMSLAAIAVGFTADGWQLNVPAKLAFAGAALTAAVTVVLALLLHRSRSRHLAGARDRAAAERARSGAWMERRRARLRGAGPARRDATSQSSRRGAPGLFSPLLLRVADRRRRDLADPALRGHVAEPRADPGAGRRRVVAARDGHLRPCRTRHSRCNAADVDARIKRY